MRKKILLLIISMLIMILFISSQNISYADDLGYQPNCPGSPTYGHWDSIRYQNIVDATHEAVRYCKDCNCQYSKNTESHTASKYTYNSGTGTHEVKCACGHVIDSNESCTRGAYTPYSSTLHESKCTLCSGAYRPSHTFDTNPCPTCGEYQTCKTCNGTYHTCNTCEHEYVRTYGSSITGHIPIDTCSKCNDVVTGEEEDHDLESEILKEATCNQEGTESNVCTICDYSYTSIIEKKEHNWGQYVANGSIGHRRKCIDCDTYTTTEEHNFGSDWVPTITSPSFSHCQRCSICNYEKNTQVHDMIVIWTGIVDGKQQHRLGCSLCEYKETEENCTYSSEIIKETSCTDSGTKRYTCVICEQYYDEEIEQLSHIWSDWETSQTQHWKDCTYNCGNRTELGNHIDESPRDGRCDICDYLMHIAPIASISSDVTVKEGEKAIFTVNVSDGTEPLSYQWYYKTSTTSDAKLVSGANESALTITATKEMDGRLYYCVISNPLNSYTTNTSKLTVYYPFVVELQPKELNLKKDSTGTLKVEITTQGNPAEYKYQWYVANSLNGTGTKISGAINSTYTVVPTQNISAEYYYCVVNNNQYEIASSRAKLTADVTIPNITIGTFNQNIYINKTEILKIPFIVSDTGNGYIEDGSNFTSGDIQVLVNGTINNEVKKYLNYTSTVGNEHFYELTLTNITGDGQLSFDVNAGAVQDRLQNKNDAKSFKTNVIIDNTIPVISFEEIIDGVNGKYINIQNTLKLKLSVFDDGGFDSAELTVDDIMIKVGSNVADSTLLRTLEYKERLNNKYIYELVLSNIKGDGELALTIEAQKIKDLANNYNTFTNFNETTNFLKERITVDNTKPIISNIVTTLGGYNTSRDYPTSIDARHNEWANENIFIQINATDDNEIDYYMKSIGNKSNFERVDLNQIMISRSIEDYIYFRVVDKAGNYEDRIVDATGNYKDARVMIKMDDDEPKKPEIAMFEERKNGAYYNYNPSVPSDKSIYVIPKESTVADSGDVQSGIETDAQYTYYTIDYYTDKTAKETLKSQTKHAWNEGVLLDEYGYFEIKMVIVDIAGNQKESETFKVLIDKKVENTIKISNINDIGSGVKKVTINVYKSNASGGKTTNKAVDTIIVNDPYREIIKNVRLGEGKFFVEVILEDNVGLTTKKEYEITNNL